MNRDQIIEFEQVTRSPEDLFKSKEVKELINKEKNKNKKLSFFFLSLLTVTIFSYNINVINLSVTVIGSIFLFMCMMEYFDNVSKSVIKKNDFNKMLNNKYGIEFSLKTIKNNVDISDFKNIKENSEEYMENIDYDKIDYAILFLYERYIHSDKEDQKSIEKRLNNVRKKAIEYKEALANRKEILKSVIKERPEASELFDNASLVLTEEEEKLTTNNKKIEILKKEYEKKMKEINIIKIEELKANQQR